MAGTIRIIRIMKQGGRSFIASPEREGTGQKRPEPDSYRGGKEDGHEEPDDP